MNARQRVRLIDLVTLIPNDITTGIVKCKSGKRIEFTDVSHLTLQYQLDTVESFDIKNQDSFGNRVLLAYLAHN